MQKLRQVIRFYGQGKDTKAISRMLGMSRNTIKKYLQILHSSDIGYDTFSAMTDSELSTLFLVSKSNSPKPQRQIDRETLLPDICK